MTSFAFLAWLATVFGRGTDEIFDWHVLNSCVKFYVRRRVSAPSTCRLPDANGSKGNAAINNNNNESVQNPNQPRMSATSKVTAENGALAHVNFRVRCETLGHGEAVFLIEERDTKMQKVRDAVGRPRDLGLCVTVDTEATYIHCSLFRVC